ncbi:MBL fold metallo-hydrolase [Alicyclobacillus fastidiosus]|uniref:MBL fold metallo-hydrolase n=1 Tax=Alicyclobacillus fastidiosus TaxID=392011 RepID=A0ABV5AA43_9BACL|nr:MBL fold metallo-hydrolase [Alicyclobacillus fastidiosus]WEH07720.1 MBL fold metallo-hydrolase [Alicyclobacillus fastidiosus]
MVRLIGDLHVVAGSSLTHPWDASAYFIAGDEPVLIDCGSVRGYPKLKENLRQLGYEPKDIRKVIATHGHWDHVSGLAELRKESDAQFYIHADDKQAVETGDFDLTAAFLYNESFPPIKFDQTLADGDTLKLGRYEFQVMHTPGHSPGSICLYGLVEGMRLLIAGDTLWGGFHPRVHSSLEAWAVSLDRLLELDFEVTTWGHGAPSLIYEAKEKAFEARQQLGVYFNPWFKPFHTQFKY